jgi:hypothetical protein
MVICVVVSKPTKFIISYRFLNQVGLPQTQTCYVHSLVDRMRQNP